MIPVPKPKTTTGCAIALTVTGILEFVNPDKVGRNADIRRPVLGALIWAVGIYFIFGSVLSVSCSVASLDSE